MLSQGDVLGYGVFFLAWVGYTAFADHSRWRTRSITSAVDRHRLRWMQVAATREPRIVDTSILGNLLTGISFFASTTILAIGGLLAGFGAFPAVQAAMAHLPWAAPLGAEDFAVKMGLLLAIFVYAFFKFAWAFRLCNYCSIVVGSIPMPGKGTPEETEARVAMAARLSSLSAYHFNRGLRAYFFAMASLGGFVHPALFIAMTLGVLVVLFRREFLSRALTAVSAEPDPPARDTKDG